MPHNCANCEYCEIFSRGAYCPLLEFPTKLTDFCFLLKPLPA